MRIHFVINPRAGKVCRRELAAAIREEFAGHDIRISPQPPVLPARQDICIQDLLWPAKELEEQTLVVAVGGDGTVNRVINAVRASGSPVGILPCGSSNDLAGALGIPTDFHQACQIIKAARLTDIDLVSVNDSLFATCGGIGFAAEVAARANLWRQGRSRAARLARALGRKAYHLALLRELCARWHPPRARIVSQEERQEASWFSVLISNQPKFGGFSASPSASNRDGLLDLCEMKSPRRRAGMLWISLRTFLGRADTCPEVHQHQSREVTIVSKKPVPFFGDGEILEYGRFFRIQIRPRALSVVVPDGQSTWERWQHIRGQAVDVVKFFLKKEQCLPMNMSA
jgi:diacylglycerol kinase (ATP)